MVFPIISGNNSAICFGSIIKETKIGIVPILIISKIVVIIIKKRIKLNDNISLLSRYV